MEEENKLKWRPVEGMPGMYELSIEVKPIKLSPHYAAFCDEMQAMGRGPFSYLGYLVRRDGKEVCAGIKGKIDDFKRIFRRNS